jgi:hypothetical protein
MKMAAALPTDTRKNGMGEVADLLVRYPDRPILCLVWLDSNQLQIDHDKHTKTPTARVKHIEPLISEYDHDTAVGLLHRAYLGRTSEQLELDLGFNVPPKEFPMPQLPVSRWRGIDHQGNISADVLAEPPDDQEPEVDKDDETGPPEVDMDALPDAGEDEAASEEVDPDAEKATASDG